MAEITFFAAECMEFPERLGELHENLTLSEAVDVYMWIWGDPEDSSNYCCGYFADGGRPVDYECMQQPNHLPGDTGYPSGCFC